MMRNNRGRARAAIIGFWLIISGLTTLILVYMLVIYLRYSFKNGPVPSLDFLYFAKMITYLGLLFFAVTFVICALTFILWFTRAYRNLHMLLPNSQKKYPFWTAAIVWFVPFFNFVGPYQIATDLFDKTERYLLSNDVMDLRPKYDITKGSWWAISVTSVVMIALSIRYMIRNIESNIGFLGQLAGCMIAIVSVIFAIKMIKNYREMEELIKQIDTGNANFQLKDGDLLD